MRAFTIWPAEIFGVENQLGSVETGKIANLTVMRGDLFARDSRVAHIFIDGRQIDLRPTAVGGPARTNLSGTWTVNLNLGQGDRTITEFAAEESGSPDRWLAPWVRCASASGG